MVEIPQLQVAVLLGMIDDPVIEAELTHYPDVFVKVTAKGL